MQNENSHASYVRWLAQTKGHICVSFNSLASPHELIVARAELLAACDRAQLRWGLRFSSNPSRSQGAHKPFKALQPLLVLVSRHQQEDPTFIPFEAQYLTRAARKKQSNLMRLTLISDAAIEIRTLKHLQKKWQFASPFFVNLPRDFVHAQPEHSPAQIDELDPRHLRPAMRFKWQFDLTHPQNYRRWEGAREYSWITRQRTESDFRTDAEGERIRRFAQACDEIEAAIAAPMIEHCAAYDGYTPCHGEPFDQRDPKRRRPVVVAHVDFVLREDDFDFEPGTHNIFYRFSNALFDELLNDIARAAYKNNGVAPTYRTSSYESLPRRWDISGGKLFKFFRNEIDDTDKMRIGKICATIELYQERPPDHNTPLEVARRMPLPMATYTCKRRCIDFYR